MKYTITTQNKSFEKYFNANDADDAYEHEIVERYVANSFEACKNILKNVLDIPTSKLMLDEIKQDFSPFGDLSNDEAKRIQNYYNSRLDLYDRIVEGISTNEQFDIYYEIPEEQSTYTEHDDDRFKFASSYIQISAK